MQTFNLDSTNIDAHKLVEEIKYTSNLIRQHKNNIRRPHHVLGEDGKPTINKMEIEGKTYTIWWSQSKLVELKAYVTFLCSIRAAMRGKVHRTTSKKEALKVQEEFINDYALFSEWWSKIKVLDQAA